MEQLNRELLQQVVAGFVKQSFVSQPGARGEPIAGSSQMTAALSGAPPGAAPGGAPQPGAPPGAPQPGAPAGPQFDPASGAMVDPNTGMPIDPNTGMPVDPSTGMPIDPATGQPMDPAAMQGAPPEGTAPAEEQPPSIQITIDDLKTVVETAVKDVLNRVLPKELAALVKGVSKQQDVLMKNVIKSQEQALQTMQGSIPPPAPPPPAPAPAPKAAPSVTKTVSASAPGGGEQGSSDPMAGVMEALTRNNQLLQDLLGGMGN